MERNSTKNHLCWLVEVYTSTFTILQIWNGIFCFHHPINDSVTGKILFQQSKWKKTKEKKTKKNSATQRILQTTYNRMHASRCVTVFINDGFSYLKTSHFTDENTRATQNLTLCSICSYLIYCKISNQIKSMMVHWVHCEDDFSVQWGFQSIKNKNTWRMKRKLETKNGASIIIASEFASLLVPINKIQE